MNEKIHELMEVGIREKVFAGAQLVVSREGALLHHGAYGVTDYESGERVTPGTIFDLASLTKPLGTALAVMKLREMKKMELSRSIGDFLPGFGRDFSSITIERLLTHSAGLPAHRPYYELLGELPVPSRRDAITKLIMKEPPECSAGTDVIYSDLGFIVLAMAVEAAAGCSLSRFLERTIYGPMGVSGLHFPGMGEGLPGRRYAATERCPRRKTLLKGVVHDDNAFALGGVCGHAGLFGTASHVHRLLAALLAAFTGKGEPGVFRRDSVRKFLVPVGNTGRTLGFDTPSRPVSSCGSLFSENTVGHLGFTGTSFWVDLEKQVVVVLLTNRVHPSRENIGIKKFRPRLHDGVMKAMESVGISLRTSCR